MRISLPEITSLAALYTIVSARHYRTDNVTIGYSNDDAFDGISKVSHGVIFTSLTPVLTTYMYKDVLVALNYTINCQSASDTYTFIVSLAAEQVARITEVTEAVVPGVLATCSAFGAVFGTLDVRITGVLPGRAWLRIDVSASNLSSTNPVHGALGQVSSVVISHDNTSVEYSYSTEHYNSYPQAGTATKGSDNSTNKLPIFFRVVCMKEQTTLDTVFRVLMVVFLLCLTVAMGCKTELHVIREAFRRPIGPAIGLGCQSLIMPLIGFGLTMAVEFPSPTMAMGFFACGCAPGGGASNFYAYLLGGDVSLSVAMTTISNIAAIGTFPLWIFTLGRYILTDQSQIKIPYVNIIISVLMIALPLSVGIALKRKRPAFTKSLLKYLMPLTVVLLLVLSAFGLYLNSYMFFLITPSLLAATFFLPNIGFLVGLSLARLFKQSWKYSRTIAIETGVQNIGIAFIMVMFSFPPPDNVLAGIAPVTSSMMTSIPLLLMAAIYRLYLRFYAAKNVDEKAAEEHCMAKLEPYDKLTDDYKPESENIHFSASV